MSAGQTPSGSDQFPWFKVGGMVGGAAVGANTVHHNQENTRNNRLLREQQRGESLKRGDLTAKQYVLYSARDGRSAREIKETLDACGGIHEGHDYSNPDGFDVEEVHVPSSDPIKWVTDQSCRLKRYPSNKGKKKWFGLRLHLQSHKYYQRMAPKWQQRSINIHLTCLMKSVKNILKAGRL